MKKVLSTTLVALVLAISFNFYACQSIDEDCGEIACTLDFRVENIIIKDQNQNPVALDSYQVINVNTNEDLTLELSPEEFQFAQQIGMYPLVNDLSTEPLESIEIQFKGFINSVEVVTENYTASSDCCHVGISEGNQQITITQ